MKNLEQIRAMTAMAYANASVNTRGSQGGEVVKKLPALIMSNGLLAAGAFAYQKQQDNLDKQRREFERENRRRPTPKDEERFEGEGWSVCFGHLAKHLAHLEVAVVPGQKNTLTSMMIHLSEEADSHTLKLATEEALAWLAYARRFVQKGAEEEGEE